MSRIFALLPPFIRLIRPWTPITACASHISRPFLTFVTGVPPLKTVLERRRPRNFGLTRATDSLGVTRSAKVKADNIGPIIPTEVLPSGSVRTGWMRVAWNSLPNIDYCLLKGCLDGGHGVSYLRCVGVGRGWCGVSCGCDVSCGDLCGLICRMLGDRSRRRKTKMNGGSRNRIQSGCSGHLVQSELLSRSGELDRLVEFCVGSFKDVHGQVLPERKYKTFDCGLAKARALLADV